MNHKIYALLALVVVLVVAAVILQAVNAMMYDTTPSEASSSSVDTTSTSSTHQEISVYRFVGVLEYNVGERQNSTSTYQLYEVEITQNLGPKLEQNPIVISTENCPIRPIDFGSPYGFSGVTYDAQDNVYHCTQAQLTYSATGGQQ